MATEGAPVGADGTGTARGSRAGSVIVLGVLLVTALAALAVFHDASTTGAVISVPATSRMPRPVSAAVARRDTLSFLPSSASLSVAQAIAVATGTPVSALAVHATLAESAGGTWNVHLVVPVHEAALLRRGSIFTGVGQGASNLHTGILQVTSGQLQFVVRASPKSQDAVFWFRLAKSGDTLSAMDWNANTVLSQTQIGQESIP